MEAVKNIFLEVLNMTVTGSVVMLAVLLVRIFLRKVPRETLINTA